MKAVQISSLLEVTSSKRIYAKEYVEDGVPFFRGKEIVEMFKGSLSVSTELYISQNRFDQIKDQFGAPKKGDLLLTSVGTIGVPFLVSTDDDFYFKDGNLTWFRGLVGIKPRYLYYWLQSTAGKAELSKCTIGSAQPAYTIEKLKKMSIFLPSMSVQERVCEILSAYDDLLENNRRRIVLLEEAARQLYKEWFVRFRFPGHEHVPLVDGVPEGWEPKPLGEVLTLQRGFDLPLRDRKEGEVPIYASTGVNGFHNEAKVKAPGLITGRSGSLGQVMLVLEDFWPLNTALWVKEFRQVDAFFAYFLLGAMSLEKYNGGSAVPTLNRNDVHRIEVVLPKEKILRDFTDIVSPSFTQQKNLRLYNDKLTQARDLLLPKLMSGDITV